MNINCATILDKWAEYTKYDPNQHSFTLGSANYEFHRACEKIQDILDNFEPTGELAVIFAKKSFYSIMKQCKISIYDVLSNPNNIADDVRIYEIFNSPKMGEIEKSYLDGCNELIKQIHGTDMLGKRNIAAEQKVIYDAIEIVVDEIRGLHIDTFMKGKEFKQVNRISTKVSIFDTMAECILTIEKQEDGIYLCFISDHGTTGGYFSFIVKSNGNMVSLNDRVNEAYQGQHKHSRNGRWMEAKKYNLFPYNMIRFDGSDYKGYATRMRIDDTELRFMSFGPEIYLPIVLAMVILSKKFIGDVDTGEPKLSSALLEVNRLSEPEVNELIVVGHSDVATIHNEFKVNFTSDDVIHHKPAIHYSYRNEDAHYSERGAFLPYDHPTTFYNNCEFTLIDLYSDGFEVDFSTLNKSNHFPRLGHDVTEEDDMDSEFIGTYNRMNMQAYMDARTQLAEYVRNAVYEDYNKLGGIEGICKWYSDSIKKNLTFIQNLCVTAYKSNDIPDLNGGYYKRREGFMNCISIENSTYVPYQYRASIFCNEKKNGSYDEFLCPITGNTVNLWFIFQPSDPEELAYILGTDNLPRLIKAWKLGGHGCPGNPLLESHDPAMEIGTPMEYRESYKYKAKYPDSYCPEYRFAFALGFSKRGFNKLLKG